MEQNLLIFYLILTVFALLLMGYDKACAKKGARRIRESSLMVLATVGGAAGIFLGMRMFRHKTRKPKFSIGIPILCIVHVMLTIAVLYIW